MRYFRVQLADRDVSELLDPDYQISHAANRNPRLTRRGVSACESLKELAEYLISGNAGAFSGVRETPGYWRIIEFEGTESGDAAVDPGEVLTIPARIVSAQEVDSDFLELMNRMEIEVFGEPENLWED